MGGVRTSHAGHFTEDKIYSEQRASVLLRQWECQIFVFEAVIHVTRRSL